MQVTQGIFPCFQSGCPLFLPLRQTVQKMYQKAVQPFGGAYKNQSQDNGRGYQETGVNVKVAAAKKGNQFISPQKEGQTGINHNPGFMEYIGNRHQGKCLSCIDSLLIEIVSLGRFNACPEGSHIQKNSEINQ